MKLGKRNIAIILSVCAILVGVLSLALTVKDFQKTLIEKQDENMMEIAGITDRNVSNILKSDLAELRYAIRQPNVIHAERIWRGSGNNYELQENLSSLLANIGNAFIGTIVVSNGKVIAASDVSYGYSFYDADRFVNNEAGLDLDYVTRLKDGKETIMLALVVPNTKKDLLYAALYDMKALYRQIAYTSVEGEKKILLYCNEYGVFLHDPGDYQSQEAMDMIYRNGDIYPEVRILKDSESGKVRSADTFIGKDSGGNETQHRIVVLPSSINRNGVFAVAILDSYENTILPINAAMFRLVGSLVLTVLGIALMLFMLYQLNRAEIRQQNEIELLKVKQRETQEIMEKTQELAHTQRLTMIGTMTAGIAHEFNNLLTPIMGYSIMTMDKLPPDDTECNDNLIEIYEAARKAKAIISRLSMLSRKTTPGGFQPCRPDKIAEDAAASAKPLKPLNTETILELNCGSLEILANEIELHQLLLNLIINSFHAIGDREGHVTVGTKPVENGVQLFVKDDGPGIPKEFLHRIYDPFFTTKESGKGTGLGLAIAAQAVNHHNGRISVETEEGKGCCFTVFIPLTQEKTES